jgi:DsbC/DsbD-like thiol-disulfide interchange protein/cytochrome c biogenesis protein CcdA
VAIGRFGIYETLMSRRQGFFVRLIRFAVLAFMLAFTGAIAGARAANHIDAVLIAESKAPRAGGTTTIALRMRPQETWHGYWANPGEAGFPARLEWTLPKGVTIDEPRYPVPERLLISGLMNHIYHGEYALLARLTVPAGLASGTKLPIQLSADWLACTNEICVPERGKLSLDLVVGDGRIAELTLKSFDKWRTKLPRPLGSDAQYQIEGDKIRVGIPFPESAEIKNAWFFSKTEDALNYATPQRVSRVGDLVIVETKLAGSVPPALEGVLATGDGQGLDIKATAGTVPFGGNVIGGREAAPSNIATIFLALGGAVLGGLLLNIMPCVFPVISLKAISLARSGGNAKDMKREALAYSVGVILTCVALGGLLLGLRAAGMSVGWAFQLQDPRVILFLLLLVSAIALNLAGLFHLRGFGGGDALAGQSGVAGAFWTGALAAFVATPCTGPFMAAALGAALVLPTLAALAIFAGLGLGLALPFLALGYVPAFRNRMPKPGPWMVTLQRWLSIPMFLTATALAWLLSRQTGQGGLLIGLAAVALLVAALWFGRRMWMMGLGFGTLLAGLIVLALVGAPLLPKPGVVQKLSTDSIAFNETKLEQLRKERRPVFLYFTADWCLTCKVNEKAAVEREEVRLSFKAKGIAVMVGDWTNGDAAISRFLEAHGRSGVPFYLFYPANADQPRELPQVLTPGLLTGL